LGRRDIGVDEMYEKKTVSDLGRKASRSITVRLFYFIIIFLKPQTCSTITQKVVLVFQTSIQPSQGYLYLFCYRDV
jgi:hypothetical protein